jgi:DNA (cytosine-5)-methyltransferase 1
MHTNIYLEHFKEFDFIWSSPPCPTHSRIQTSFKNRNTWKQYPDMKLYEEIIFLETIF